MKAHERTVRLKIVSSKYKEQVKQLEAHSEKCTNRQRLGYHGI